MTRRTLAAGIVVGLPLLVAAGWALLAWSGVIPDPRLFVRGAASAFILTTGLGLSLVLLGLALLAAWGERRARRLRAKAQTTASVERRRFLQRLDHELKNPLTAIRAGLANLPPEAGGPALASIEAQVMRVSRLTSDLRKLADLESRPLELGPVNVAELLAHVHAVGAERPEAGQRRLALSLPQAPWPVPEIGADYDLLFLAALNLVDNALEFSRPGDTIEVRAREDASAVVIDVADTGPGIAPDDLPRVWDELYRGANAGHVPGSGLGLALAKAIFERHGGALELRSQLGKGTVFTARLPLSPI
jgi:signal transduction histidine kinase